MSSSRLNKKTLSQEDLFNLSELFKLMKPRVMSLVIFTWAVGLLTSPGIISTKDAIIGILLVSIGAGAAGALNMWYDADTDSKMSRTANRPIPSGRLSSREALLFGLTCATLSIILLAISTNLIARYMRCSLPMKKSMTITLTAYRDQMN